MINDFYKDVMSQNFETGNYNDCTRLFVILSLLEFDCSNGISSYDISTYVYRYYIANPSLTLNNMNVTIRNIKKYGIKDILNIVENAISNFCNDSIKNTIIFKNGKLYSNVDFSDKQNYSMIKQLVIILFDKYFHTKINDIKTYEELLKIDDLNLSEFGDSDLKELIMEDIQYCQLSEETRYEKLKVVHIFNREDGADDKQFLDKNNLILLAEDLAFDYNDKRYHFDERGRVVNSGSSIIDNKMRLSVKFLNSDRINYIRLHNKKVE